MVAFERRRGTAAVVVVANLTDRPQAVTLPPGTTRRELFGNATARTTATGMSVPPHGYQVWQ